MSSTQESTSSHLWYALDVDVEYAAREAVEYGLMEAGALGTETETGNPEGEHLLVTAYFDQVPDHSRVFET